MSFLASFLRSFLWNHRISNIFQKSCLVFSTLQSMAVLIWIQCYYITSDQYDIFTYALKRAASILCLRSFFDSLSTEQTAQAIALSFALCYFLTFLGIFSLIAHCIWHKIPYPKVEKLALYLGQFHINFGFWFFSLGLLKFINHALETSFSDMTTFQLASFVIYILCLVLNYLFGFVLAIFSYDPFTTSNFLATHSSDFQILTFTFKAIIAPLTMGSKYSLYHPWVLVVLSLIIQTIRYYHLIHSFPYYKFSAMKTSLIFSGISLLISSANFIGLIIKSFTPVSPSVLLYFITLLVPLFLKLVNIHLNTTIEIYFALHTKDMKSNEDVLKKLFAISHIIKNVSLTLAEHLSRSCPDLKFWGALSWADQESQGYKETMHLDQASNKPLPLHKMEKIYNAAEEKLVKTLLQETIANFRDNSKVKMIFAHFTLNRNFPHLVPSLLLSNSKSFRGRTRIVAMTLKERLQNSINNHFEENTGKVLNLKNFLEYEGITRNLVDSMKSIAQKYIGFWTIYSESQVMMKQMYIKSKEIEKEAGKIKTLWESYANENKIFAHLFSNTYSQYLSIIRGSPFESQKILERYVIPQLDQKVRSETKEPLSEETLMAPNVVAFYSNIDKENPGKIVYSSSNLAGCLGWTQLDILDHYIERIMPSFMHQPHQRLLRSHCENVFNRKASSRLYKSLDSFVMHKHGYIVPCEVYLSIHPYVQETPMYLVLLRTREIRGDYLLVSNDGNIEGFTSKVGQTLGLSSERKISLRNICKNFKDVEDLVCPDMITDEDLSKYKSSFYSLDKKKSLRFAKDSFVLTFFTNHSNRSNVKGICKFNAEIKQESFGDQLYSVLHLRQISHNSRKRKNSSDDDNFDEELIDENDIGTLPVFIPRFDTRKTELFEFQTVKTETDPYHKGQTMQTQTDPLITFTERDILRNYRSTENFITLPDERLARNTQLSPFRNIETRGTEEGEILISPTGSARPFLRVSPERQQNRDLQMVLKKANDGRVFDFSAEASSANSTMTNYMGKLEQAVKDTPKDPQVNAFYYILLLFISISGILLIVFRYQNENTLDLVISNSLTISTSFYRLVRIIDVGQTARIFWQSKIGLFNEGRYDFLGWDDSKVTELPEYLMSVADDLNNRNNDLMNVVFRLDSKLQQELFLDKLPAYQLNKDSIIEATRYENTFYIITELVDKTIHLVQSELPINEQNPYLLFCLNNTFNDVYVSSQRIIPILRRDIVSKFDSQLLNTYIMMICLSIIGTLILLYFVKIIYDFIKGDREQFLNLFIMLNDQAIQKHIRQTEGFISLLEKNYSKGQNLKDRSAPKTLKHIPVQERGGKQIKKTISMSGINLKLIGLFLIFFITQTLIFSAFPFLILIVSSKNRAILTKMDLRAQSNQNLLNIDFLVSTIYEYVQENISTNMTNKPIKEAWDETFLEVAKIPNFLVNEILGSDIGLNNDELNDIVKGGLCDILPPNDDALLKVCKTIGGGANERGMVGLTSYILSSTKEVTDYYQNSDRSWNSKLTALTQPDFVTLDAFYPFILNVYSWLDDAIRTELRGDILAFRDVITDMVIIYWILYAFLGLVVARRNIKGLQKEMTDWRKILVLVPYPIIKDSKLIKSYLARRNKGLLQI